jgi:hypothetical protein
MLFGEYRRAPTEYEFPPGFDDSMEYRQLDLNYYVDKALHDEREWAYQTHLVNIALYDPEYLNPKETRCEDLAARLCKDIEPKNKIYVDAFIKSCKEWFPNKVQATILVQLMTDIIAMKKADHGKKISNGLRIRKEPKIPGKRGRKPNPDAKPKPKPKPKPPPKPKPQPKPKKLTEKEKKRKNAFED